MKKTSLLLLPVLLLALLLTGCSGAAFTMTTAGNRSSIQANNAADGVSIESSPFSVGKGKTAVVESSLNKGELRIDFVSVTVIRRDDVSEEVIPGDVIASVTVGPGDGSEFPLDRGDYILQITAVGAADGTVNVSFR